MIRFTPRRVWLALSAGGIGLALGSVLLTEWLHLAPCHLCIFQRLLFMVLGVLAAGAAFSPRLGARIFSVLILLTALLGMGSAAYQSWLQLQPQDSTACLSSQPGLIERLVEWLGQQVPSLFLATGFCEEQGLVILGLSLANWAFLGFAAALIVAVWGLWSTWGPRPG